jgi:phosphate transport system substrate-binding protein
LTKEELSNDAQNRAAVGVRPWGFTSNRADHAERSRRNISQPDVFEVVQRISRQVSEGTVDFGASDMPMKDDQLKAAEDKLHTKVLNIPTVLGAVVPAYNIPGVSAELKFTPEILAEIFLGKISNWNDKAIAAVNSGVNFPNQEIVVVHRSDGSGTTFVWTDYLSKVSNDWKNQVGADTSVKWPKGLGGKGNDGVAGSIRQLPGSIGYIELIYAVQNKIAFGSVKNSSGAFIKASLDGVTAAAASAPKMPADFRVSITNAPGKDAYPISSFTWLLIPQASKDSAKGKILADFLNWMIADGQKMAGALDYAPLPDNVAAKVKETIKQVK